MDKAAPLRKDGNTWQCPFCGQDDFPELTEVWNHFDAGTCPGKAQARGKSSDISHSLTNLDNLD